MYIYIQYSFYLGTFRISLNESKSFKGTLKQHEKFQFLKAIIDHLEFH